GLMSRFLAWLLDLIIVIGLTVASVIVITQVLAFFPGVGQAVIFITYFLLDWGYAIATETFWSGQTVGKRVLGLRVIQQSGVRIGFYQAVICNLVRVVDRQPAFMLFGPGFYLLGAAVAAFSGSQQR